MTEPNIELLNIDCLHYMKQCEDNQFDLAIVDPPYGININKHHKAKVEELQKRLNTQKKIGIVLYLIKNTLPNL